MSDTGSRASVRRKSFVALVAAGSLAASIMPGRANAYDPAAGPSVPARTGCHAAFAYSGGEDHVAEFFNSAGVDHKLGVVVGLRFAFGSVPKHRAAAPQLALWHPGGGTAANIECGGRN